MRKQAKELKIGDKICAAPSASLGWTLSSLKQNIEVSNIQIESGDCGCRVTVWAKGIERPFLWVRGSTVIKVY